MQNSAEEMQEEGAEESMEVSLDGLVSFLVS
jgi:hypothetical protein